MTKFKIIIALMCLALAFTSVDATGFIYYKSKGKATEIYGGAVDGSDRYINLYKQDVPYPKAVKSKNDIQTIKKKTTKKKVKKNHKASKKVTNKLICKNYWWDSKTFNRVIEYERTIKSIKYKKKKKYTTVTKQKVTATRTYNHFKKLVSVDVYAPRANKKVRDAYKKYGWKLYHNTKFTLPHSPRWSESLATIGLTSYTTWNNQTIKEINVRNPETTYHELGHFIALNTGRPDLTDEFKKIRDSEHNNIKINDSAVEYFAESYAYYCADPARMKTQAPKTYAYLLKQINKL